MHQIYGDKNKGRKVMQPSVPLKEITLMKNDNILNSTHSLFMFFSMKFGACIGIIVLSGICYTEYLTDISFWPLYGAGAVLLFFLGDSFALPVKHVEGGIKYHHLWRTSTLLHSKAKVCYKGQHLDRRWCKKKEEELLIVTSHNLWQIYIVWCDLKNGLTPIYDKLKRSIL